MKQLRNFSRIWLAVMVAPFLLASCIVIQTAPDKEPDKSAQTTTIVPEKPKAVIPAWYTKRSAGAEPGYLYGYGSGRTEDEAKGKALKEISESISVEVRSEYRLESNAAKGAQGEILSSASRVNQDIRVSSQNSLKNSQRLRGEKSGDLYYVIYRFDNRTLEKRLADLMPAAQQSAGGAAAGPFDFLPVAQSLKKAGKAAAFEIVYRDRAWYVAAGGKYLEVRPKEWFSGFFTELADAGLTLNIIPGSELKNEDFYQVELKTKIGGYASLFHVSENGQVLRLEKANKKISSGRTLLFPNPEQYSGLMAENLTDFNQTRDLLLVVVCPKSQSSLPRYAGITDEMIDTKDDRLYSYPQLLKDTVNCARATKFLFITKN